MYHIHSLWPAAPPGPPTLTGRLGLIVHGLHAATAVRASQTWVMAPLVLLFSAYLSSVMRRFEALAARFEAGLLRAPRPKRPQAAQPQAAQPRAAECQPAECQPAECQETEAEPRKGAPKPRLPQQFGWLIDFIGYQAAGHASQLRHLLANDADMKAMMAASPQAARILRPLCRMLGIEPAPDLPPSLFPPRVATAQAEPTPDSMIPDRPGAPSPPFPPGQPERPGQEDGASRPGRFSTPA